MVPINVEPYLMNNRCCSYTPIKKPKNLILANIVGFGQKVHSGI